MPLSILVIVKSWLVVVIIVWALIICFGGCYYMICIRGECCLSVVSVSGYYGSSFMS